MDVPEAVRVSGLRKLFDKLVEEVTPDAQRHALWVAGGDRSLAHDLFMEAWLAALRAFPGLEPEAGNVYGYMCGAVDKGFASHLRKRGRLVSLDTFRAPEPYIDAALPAETVNAGQLPADLAQRLNRLPPLERELMSLYSQGYSEEWVSEALGLADETEYRKIFQQAVRRLRQADLPATAPPVPANLPLLTLRASVAPGIGRVYSANAMSRELGASISWVLRYTRYFQPVALKPGGIYGPKPQHSEQTLRQLMTMREALTSVPYATSLHATRHALAGMLDPPQSWEWVDQQLLDIRAPSIELRTGKSPGRIREHFLVAEVLPELQGRIVTSDWMTETGMCRALGRSLKWLKPRIVTFEDQARTFPAFDGPGSNQSRRRYPPHVFAEMRRLHEESPVRNIDPYLKWRQIPSR